jgi:branched-subunit amino acid permease
MNFLSGMWNSVVWFFNPSQDTNQIKKDGGQIANNVSGAVDNVQSLLPTIKTDLEWLIIALVGLLAYAFIFKK